MTPYLSTIHQEHKARLLRLNMRAPEAGPLVSKPQPKTIPIIGGKQVVPPSPPPPPARDWLLIASALIPVPLNSTRTIKQIQVMTAAKFGLQLHDLFANRRTWDIVRPRQVAMYLACRWTKKSLPEIGRLFGGRDHTTVLHAKNAIEALRTRDPDLNAKITELEAELESGAVA